MIKNLTEAIINTNNGVKNIEGNAKTNEILYSRWEKRYSKTIKEFYEDFIEPRTPDIAVLIKWNELLSWYIDQPNIIYFLRAGNTDGSNRLCRRGWMCIQKSFSGDQLKYIYDDNDLASYIYKMALDGFCPSKKEFLSFMTEFKDVKDIKWINTTSKSFKKIDTNRRYLSFPGKFTQNVSYEYKKNVMLLSGITPVCCLGKYNYKHSHIFDVNKDTCPYYINGKKTTSKEIKERFCSIKSGDTANYLFDSSINNYFYNRPKISDIDFDFLKKFLKAHTMRFLNPFNHFLAPHERCNKFTKDDGTFNLDIAEYDKLLDYIRFVRLKNYKYYNMFVKRIDTNIDISEKNENIIINIIYHEKSLADTSVFCGYRCDDGYSKQHFKKTKITKAKNALYVSKNINSDININDLSLAYYYLCHKTTFAKIDKDILKCKYDSHGGKSCRILKKLGISKINNNTISKVNTLDDEIKKSNRQFKETLLNIKKYVKK